MFLSLFIPTNTISESKTCCQGEKYKCSLPCLAGSLIICWSAGSEDPENTDLRVGITAFRCKVQRTANNFSIFGQLLHKHRFHLGDVSLLAEHKANKGDGAAARRHFTLLACVVASGRFWERVRYGWTQNHKGSFALCFWATVALRPTSS